MERTGDRRGFEADRISNLPCNVIDNILKFLPLGEAARTSILSKGWRYKWVTIPFLAFDYAFRMKLEGKYNIESIIYQILFLHKGPIVKFTLYLNDIRFCPGLNNWLHFLSNHHVEEFRLECLTRLSVSHLLFSLEHLTHLHLANVKVRLPSTFKGFGRLVKLHLSCVALLLEELDRFISKCPMLEYIDLRSPIDHMLGHLVIDAPNLKSFHFQGILGSFYFKNASCLKEMSIIRFPSVVDTTSEPRGNNSNMIKFLSPLSSITSLKFYRGSLLSLASVGVPHKLPFNLDHIRFLVLDIAGFESTSDVRCALCLIRSSPNLQSLEIGINQLIVPDIDRLEATTQFLKAQQKYEFPLCCLENVEVLGFSGVEPEMEFVKLLLSSATALMKLEIHCKYKVGTRKGIKMLKEFLSIPRASTRAELIFKDRSGIYKILISFLVEFLHEQLAQNLESCVFSHESLSELLVALSATSPVVEDTTTQFLKEQQKCKIPLSCLGKVKILKFSGDEPEMEFVKLILSAATILRKLEISSIHAGATEAGSKMLKQLLSFQRASPRAEIIFKDP